MKAPRPMSKRAERRQSQRADFKRTITVKGKQTTAQKLVVHVHNAGFKPQPFDHAAMRRSKHLQPALAS